VGVAPNPHPLIVGCSSLFTPEEADKARRLIRAAEQATAKRLNEGAHGKEVPCRMGVRPVFELILLLGNLFGYFASSLEQADKRAALRDCQSANWRGAG
jgi:hypothetical protein